MKYHVTETTIDALIAQLAQASHAFHYRSSHINEASCLIGNAVYRAEGEIQGNNGIIDVKGSEIYFRWGIGELGHRTRKQIAAERELLFTQWTSAVSERMAHSQPTFQYLANAQPTFQYGVIMVGYEHEDIVLDATFDKEHYIVPVDKQHLAAAQQRFPGQYEDKWPTLAPMFHSGMVGLKRPKVGFAKLELGRQEKRHLHDWCVAIDHHPNSVGR